MEARIRWAYKIGSETMARELQKAETRGKKWGIALYEENAGTFTIRTFKHANCVGTRAGIPSRTQAFVMYRQDIALAAGMDGIHYHATN